MTDDQAKARRFLDLHRPGAPLLLPNAWDAGSARVLESMGFEALAMTSSGHAATLGLADGSVTREQALSHAAHLVQSTDLPISADLENGFAHEPGEVARTVMLAIEAGLAGCSIEDFTRDRDNPIYDLELAVERIAAAAEAAHDGPLRLVLTARCENHLHGRDDLADTITRLKAYRDAGADVLYAPGLTRGEDIAAVVEASAAPSTCWRGRALPRCLNWRCWGSAGSRLAARSRLQRSQRWWRRRGSSASRGRMAS